MEAPRNGQQRPSHDVTTKTQPAGHSLLWNTQKPNLTSDIAPCGWSVQAEWHPARDEIGEVLFCFSFL